VEIKSLQSTPIDLYCLKYKLNKADNPDSERVIAEGYIKTISDKLIKSEMARFLAQRWNEKDEVVRDWMSVTDKDNIKDILSEFATVQDCINAFESQSSGKEYGIGFASVDASAKIRKKDVLILGAFSFAGKTTTLAEWVLHWILREKLRVVVFSLEMDRASFMEMIIYKIIGCNSYTFRTNPEFTNYAEKIKEKLDKYLCVVDSNGLSMEDIEKRIQIANTHIFDEPVDVVAVDYFGYIKNTNDFESASAAAKKMKEIAKKYNIVFCMLSQFARTSQATEKGKPREPMLYDLKGTGDLEASADEIYLLYRPVLNTPNLSAIDREAEKYTSFLKIAKARRGIKGETHFELVYDPQTTRLREKFTDDKMQ